MARTAFTAKVKIEGLRETLDALKQLPKEASDQLRTASQDLSEQLAGRIRAAADSDSSPQSHLLSPTVKARRDRVPVVQAGGGKRVGSRGAPAYKVLFGSEFGSNQYAQFRKPHQGRKGTWFFPVVEAEQQLISQRWQEAADKVIADFSKGGGG